VRAGCYPWGLAISSRDSGDIGVGGLTIDHLVSADVVTADGRTHKVDADRDPDLFFLLVAVPLTATWVHFTRPSSRRRRRARGL